MGETPNQGSAVSVRVEDSKGSTTHRLQVGDEILGLSGRSLLVNRENRRVCLCAYLCLATTETCEFA
jgi:hypothetical protein